MEKKYNNKQTVVVVGVLGAKGTGQKRRESRERERETRQDIIFQLLLLLLHIIEPPPPHKKWEGRGPRSDNIDDGDNQQRAPPRQNELEKSKRVVRNEQKEK